MKSLPGRVSVSPCPWRGLFGVRSAAQPLPPPPAPGAPTGSAGLGPDGSCRPSGRPRALVEGAPGLLSFPGRCVRTGPPLLPTPSYLISALIHSSSLSWVLHVSPGLEPGVRGLSPHLMRGAWSPSVEGVCGYGPATRSILGFHSPLRCVGPRHPSLPPRTVPQRRLGFVLHRRVGAAGTDGGPGSGRTRGLCTVQLRPRRGGQRRRGHRGAARSREQPPGARLPRDGWLGGCSHGGGGRRSPE